jgi:hypothetical protein
MGLTRLRAQQISDIDYKQAVRATTLSNIASLTSGAPNIVDGVGLSVDDRVLVASQTDQTQNGLYYVVSAGTGSNGVWARTQDGNTTGEINAGMIVMVTEGNLYPDTLWKLITNNPIVIGTTELEFVLNSEASFDVINANGTPVSANTISSTINYYSGNNLVITGSDVTDSVTFAVADAPDFWGNVTTQGNLFVARDISVTGNLTIGANLNVVNVNEYVGATGNISFLGNLLPGSSNVINYSLGLPGQPWSNIYVSTLNVATFTGTDLSITGTLTSNTLVVSNNATVNGNLTVLGTTTTINSNIIVTNDKNIELANNISTLINLDGAGLLAGNAANTHVTNWTYNYAANAWSTNVGVSAVGNVAGSYFIGNGSQLTGIVTNYSNANVISLLSSNSNSIISTTADIGTTAVLSGASLAVGNINAIGTITAPDIIVSNNTGGTGSITATGNIQGNYIIGNGSTLTNITGANVTGTVANATFATSAGTVTTNAQPNITSVGNLTTLTVTGNVAVGNLIIGSQGAIGVAPQQEIHVAMNGSDTDGNGSITNPYRTITYAVSLIGSGGTIVVHPGGYTEDVAINNLSAIAITAAQPGAGSPQTYVINGNVTVSGTSGSVLLHSVGVVGSITHSSSGALFVTAIQMGTGGNSTTFTKTGTGYLEVTNGNWSGGTPVVDITGAGLVTFNGVQLTNLTVNNANASVLLRNIPSAVNTTLTSGTLTVINSTMVGNSNTAPAITTVAGTLNIQNSLLLRANNTAGTMTVGAATAYLYDDIFFDRANSTLSGIPISGTAFAPPAEFQVIRADSMSVTGNNIAAGNVTGGNIRTVGQITATGNVTSGNVLTGGLISATGNVFTGNINIATGGTVTVNNKSAINGPAFSAYANATLQTITTGSQQKVLFQTEEFDTNNNFADSRFTPTVEGYYQLNAEVRLDGASGTGEMMIVIWKNGSEHKRGTNQSGTQIASNFWAMQVSSLVYANGSTDYFEIYVQQGSGGSLTVTAVNSPNITWFNGCMMRGA